MNRTMSKGKQIRSSGHRRGFTLVELLVVIAIIGLLVGLTVPAVLSAINTFDKGAVKFEVQALNDAIENYRSKHGDYPPDGSSWPIMERHIRKAFPNAINTEFAILNPINGAQLDPAEALVFFLGGFSTDAQRPFTGKGGPIVNMGTMAVPIYRYNGSRENALYEFPSGRLSLTQESNGLISSDETVFAGVAGDVFPVFLAKNTTIELGAPYVYFDSRTYMFNRGTTASPIYNLYQPSNVTSTTAVNSPRGDKGAVRPHLASVSGAGFVFENNKTFQIITPGSDGRFGGRLFAMGAQWFTTTGQSYTLSGTNMTQDPAAANKFELSENSGLVKLPAYDNAGNFTESKSFGEGAL